MGAPGIDRVSKSTETLLPSMGSNIMSDCPDEKILLFSKETFSFYSSADALKGKFSTPKLLRFFMPCPMLLGEKSTKELFDIFRLVGTFRVF